MRSMRVRKAWLGVGLAIALMLAAAFEALLYARAASFVVRSAGLETRYPAVARWQTQRFSQSLLSVPSRHGPLRARLYLPLARRGRAVLLVPGVNALSIDEPRLQGFATQLAATGFVVVTPELPDLARYQITARSTDMIEDATIWLSNRRDLAGDGRVGLMGISFAGGLSVVAAGRPSVRDRVAMVFSFGGHGDFERVLRFLCTGFEPLPPGRRLPQATGTRDETVPGGVRRKPHDYGVAILALALADQLVPADQTEPLRSAIVTFLHASHLALIDQRRAEDAFAEARRLAGDLPEPAATVMAEVNNRDVGRLGPKLLPLVGDLGSDPALSPDRSPPPAAPVFLLHGSDDNVIPSMETVLLADYLEGRTAVRWLLSGLITHVEVDRPPTIGEVWRLVDFWAALMRR
jgi:dienelactone hydrolase